MNNQQTFCVYFAVYHTLYDHMNEGFEFDCVLMNQFPKQASGRVPPCRIHEMGTYAINYQKIASIDGAITHALFTLPNSRCFAHVVSCTKHVDVVVLTLIDYITLNGIFDISIRNSCPCRLAGHGLPAQQQQLTCGFIF